MSINNWIGGLIRKTPPTPSGPYQNSTAPGIWTLTQVANYVKQAIWPTAGNLNPDLFIENLFSTYLYTGNGTSQTITNNINLSGNGGLVWIKERGAVRNNLLFDTSRGATKPLYSNLTFAEGSDAQSLTAFNSTGFSIGSDSGCNINAGTYVAWTFREQAKFFDVVTYSGDGIDNRAISHNLASTPGCIIIKRTNNSDDWFVYHRSLAANFGLRLNKTDAAGSNTSTVKSVSSTTFTIGTDGLVNSSGSTYTAYLFAHDAGGFGLSGTDNVISCGSFTTDGTGYASINLGYEPQWVLMKPSSAAGGWRLWSNMLPFSTTAASYLEPNTTAAENSNSYWLQIKSTGFVSERSASTTYIYIAIRRGPMKTPTSGTSVYGALTWTGGTSNSSSAVSFPPDLTLRLTRTANYSGQKLWSNRLAGSTYLNSTSTSDEGSGTFTWDGSPGGASVVTFGATDSLVNEYFGRAPGFMDVVCYTGTGSATTFSHNLGVVPEMMIVKNRNNVENWAVYSAALGNTKRLRLNATDAAVTASAEWNNTSPTASVFTVGTDQEVNFSSNTYVAYLFATCAGVSKVGSYTGTGTTLQVNCGFTAGARFVMIKRTDSTGDWYVWDSARGIVAGDDPYLLMNSTAAEVTNTDYVDTYNAGFEISSTAPAAINANGGSFIFLAIA